MASLSVFQTVGAGPDAEYGRLLVLLHGDVRTLPHLLHLRLSDQRLHLHSAARRQVKVKGKYSSFVY